MTAKNKVLWTAEEIKKKQQWYFDRFNEINQEHKILRGIKLNTLQDWACKQFLDADEVKRIIETMDLCCTKHTYKVNDKCDIMNIKILKRLGLKCH